MTSLREMLSRLKPGEELSSDTLARIETIIEAYNAPQLDPHFRSDILSAVGSVLDIAGTMSQRTYRIDELFTEIAKVQNYLSVLLQYGLVARPKVSGFALFNSLTGGFIPGFYTTQEEALKQKAHYQALGITFPISVLPAECVAGALSPPQELKSKEPPQELKPKELSSPPPPATKVAETLATNPPAKTPFEVPPAKEPPKS